MRCLIQFVLRVTVIATLFPIASMSAYQAYVNIDLTCPTSMDHLHN
jgi:hypothetical protein